MNPISSPSFALAGETAFELKFEIGRAQATEIAAWAQQRLSLDAYGNPELGGSYDTTTVYLDTEDLDILHKSNGFRTVKHRLRRYGAEEMVHLERKTKRGQKVSKRRSTVPSTQLPMLESVACLDAWDGAWFHHEIHERELKPAAVVSYRRKAFNGVNSWGRVRLTIDEQLMGAEWSRFCIPNSFDGESLLPGKCVLELKYVETLPTVFRDCLTEFNLAPATVSKYRRARDPKGELLECLTG